MNYTLKQLQERVNKLIEKQGEDAYCAAWIYTKEDCMIRDKDDDEPVYLPECKSMRHTVHLLPVVRSVC